MVRSVEEITKELTKLNQSSLDNSINTLNQTAESDRNIINTNADVSVSNITDAYNTQIADVKEGYNEAFNRNEVQKVLNERYLERKAAEIGLTDSGMNRTQLTANQLSHANQQGRLDAALQKDVNTLAAAMRAKITEVNTNKNNSLAQIDSTLNSNIAQLRSDFNSSINQQAVDIHNAEYKAKQERLAAEHKAEQEAITAANKLASENSTKALTAADEIMTKIDSGDYSEKALNGFIDNYIAQYGGGVGLRNIYNHMNISSDDAWKDVMLSFVNKNNTDSYKKWKYITYVQTFNYPSKVALESVSNIPGCGSYSYKYLKELAEAYI